MPAAPTVATHQTIGSIRLQARSRADFLNGPPGFPIFNVNDQRLVTDTALDAWIAKAQLRLYQLLVDVSEDWFMAPPFVFTLDGRQPAIYPLPSNFLALRGVDAMWQPGSQTQNQTLRRFNFQERNNYSYSFVGTPSASFAPPYKLINSNPAQIMFPAGFQAYTGQQIQIWFTPRLTPAREWFSISFNGFGGPTGSGGNIGIGINDGDQIRFVGLADNVPILPTQTTAFHLGQNDFDAAANFATVFNAYCANVPGDLFQNFIAWADGTTITVGLIGYAMMNATTVQYSSQNSGIPQQSVLFAPNSGTEEVQGVLSSYGSFCNVIDGVTGWEDLLIAEAAAKYCAFARLDSSEFIAEVAGMEKRIKEGSQNRDAGMPARVTDSRGATGGGGGFGGGGDGWDGW